MTDTEIIEKLQALAADILEINAVTFQPETKQADIPEWDSLGHLRLMMAVEEAFNVKLSMVEIPTYNSVNLLMTAIRKQLNS